MKSRVFVLADEDWARESIIGKIDWGRLPLQLTGEASNGGEGAALVRSLLPDIVLLDIHMPGTDGLNVLKSIEPLLSRMKVIVIGDGDACEYIKETVKFGVSDYVLKPMDADELERALLRQHKSPLQKTGERSRQEAVHGDREFHAWVRRRKPLPAEFLWGAASAPELAGCAILNVEPAAESKGAGREAGLFAFRQAFADECAPYGAKVFQNIADERQFYALFRCGSIEQGSLASTIGQIAQRLKERFGWEITAGIGSSPGGRMGLDDAFSQARLALRDAVIFGPGRVYVFSASADAQAADVSEAVKRILREAMDVHLENKQVERSQQTLNLIFDTVRKQGAALSFRHRADIYGTVFAHLAERFAEGGRASSKLWPSGEFYARMNACKRMDEIEKWLRERLSSGLERLIRRMNLSGEEIVLQVKRYIDEHFDEPISLKFISDRFYLHPNYFSTLFKDHIGQSFHNYITAVRMEKSLNLLRRPREIKDVAAMVGYPDQRYFSQVFKKHIGMSPTEYMRRQGEDANS